MKVKFLLFAALALRVSHNLIGADATEASGRPTHPIIPAAGQRMKGDFNGDGKEDIAIAYGYGSGHTALRILLSSDSAFSDPALWYENKGGWESSRSQWTAGDFNADGKSDVAALYDYGKGTCKLFVFLSSGSAFAAGKVWWASASGSFDAQRSKVVTGDFDGDRKADVAIAYDYGANHTALWVFLSTGANFSDSTLWYENNGGWDAARSQWTSGDFDGDGKTDLCTLYNFGGGTSKLFVFLSSGSSFPAGETWWSSSARSFDATRSKLMAGDLNGDKRHDIAIAYDYGGSHSALWTFLSSGTKFSVSLLWWDNPTGWESARTRWVTGDFNGDGKADVSALYDHASKSTALWLFPSTGKSIPGCSVWWPGVPGFDWAKCTLF
jgi:hypothetical protein